MKFSRRASMRINDLLDQYAPPALRDSKLMGALARKMYGSLRVDLMELRQRAFYLPRAEYAAFYQELQSKFDQGVTDLTDESLAGVLAAVRGERVLDVACGLGYLSGILVRNHDIVVGCDVAVSAGRRGHDPAVRWCDGNVEELPFRDGAFDTVVSTHTLEHVQHLGTALDELRRVARRRLIVVVPRQRPYLATFNPHIHFFPYAFSLLAWTGTERSHTIDLVGGDWLYVEDQDGDQETERAGPTIGTSSAR